MMESKQAIPAPFGITVFGSATSRIAPDFASIKVTVSRLKQKPADAFAEAKKGSQAVQECLKKTEFGASRVTMTPQNRYVNGENKFLGYQANVSFHIMLSDLELVEELLTALVSAGANEVSNVSFETTRLKEVRAEARRRAMEAALEKAKNYCAVAGVSVGKVLHIEDVNPLSLQGREGHGRGEPQTDDDMDTKAFDPSAISVGAAVLVAYEICPNQPAN